MNKYEHWEKQRNTTAHKIYMKIADVNLMGHIHLGNFEKLQSELGEFNNLSAVLEAMHDRSEFKKKHLNISGLFFNYISSALSLRDSTRNLLKIKDLNLKNIESESLAIIRRDIIGNPVIKLIEDLRNIITHQSMLSPSISSYMHFNNKINMHGFAYDISALIENDRLTKQTKDYLKKQQKYLFLLPAIEEYQSTSLKYQHWILTAINDLHQKTFPEYWDARKAVMNEWGHDTPPIPSESTITYLTR